IHPRVACKGAAITCGDYRYPVLSPSCSTNGTMAKPPRTFASTAWILRMPLLPSKIRTVWKKSLTTLRDCEQHRSTPDAPARALLLAIERDPEVMRRLLADRAA